MFDIGKDQSFASRGIPLGILEVNYPAEGCGRAALHALVERELAALRERYADYDRKAVFGENPYFRFFRKFKNHVRCTPICFILWPEKPFFTAVHQHSQIFRKMFYLKDTALIMISREQWQLLCHFLQCPVVAFTAGPVDHGKT